MDSNIGLLFWMCMVGVTAVGSNYCPPPESSRTCHCFHGVSFGGNGTTVQCAVINDTGTLYKDMQNLRGYAIDYLRFRQIHLPYLPAGLFIGTKIKRIEIVGSTLENLYSVKNYKPSPFEGLENSLEEISVQLTLDPSKWLWPEMKNLRHLKKFEINMSPIHYIGHVFGEMGGGSLESITATYSSVYRIHPQAFPGLTNLKEAIFSGNYIPYLVRTMFPNPAPKLELLNFRDNKLFTLDENMFENMPALKFLDFSQNEFKTFESVVFTPVWSRLNHFYITDNPFKCDCSLIPLQQKLISKTCPPYQDLEQVTCSNSGDLKKTRLADLDEKSMHC